MAKIFTGTVVSNKMDKTLVVLVERKLRHPKYRKVIVRHKKFKVHCEDKSIKEGDVVTIKETRPISKEVKFYVVHDNVEKEQPSSTTTDVETVAVKAKRTRKVVTSTVEPK